MISEVKTLRKGTVKERMDNLRLPVHSTQTCKYDMVLGSIMKMQSCHPILDRRPTIERSSIMLANTPEICTCRLRIKFSHPYQIIQRIGCFLLVLRYHMPVDAQDEIGC